MASKEYKKIILDKLHEILKPKGFKKSGANFTKTSDDLIYSINVQSSKESTAIALKTTLNLQIVSIKLAKAEDRVVPIQYASHWRERIGFFLDKPFDKWWTIETDLEAEQASNEIVDLMTNKVLTEFDRLKTLTDLVNLWRGDKCPGLSEKQRLIYLQLTKTLLTTEEKEIS